MQHIVLKPHRVSYKLSIMLEALLAQANFLVVTNLKNIVLNEGDILFIAADVNLIGDCVEITQALNYKITYYPKQFNRVKCGLLVSSETAYHTKDYAKRIAFVLNRYGAYFNGHALVEAVKDFKNFETWQKSYQLPLKDVCKARVKALYENMHEVTHIKRKKILALHASSRSKSNTYALWSLVNNALDSSFSVKELHIENGNIVDCKGCSYKTCLHYAKSKQCYYGGQVTSELLPAIENADIIIWICPNYNDAVSAMHTALINRLTVLYRRISLSHKQIYGIVISANSGSDIVSGQLISALNFNKKFMVPPKAMLCELANDPASILQVEHINKRAQTFAELIFNNRKL